MRGKVARASAATTARGITPACAGKSAPWAKQKGGVGDHPRVCGEKAFHLIFPPLSWGSPPRVRGKVFSPALWMPLPKDHPRVCGEKAIEQQKGGGSMGSPPRVRGKVPP